MDIDEFAEKLKECIYLLAKNKEISITDLILYGDKAIKLIDGCVKQYKSKTLEEYDDEKDN